MFSYSITNSNNFIIKDDYHVIPFGHRCASAIACKNANLRKFSLPFDWGIPFFPSTIKKILENNFSNFTDFEYRTNDLVYNKTYDFGSGHYNADHDVNVETFTRRINRFNDIIIQRKKIYFVYINEDYLYDDNFRKDEFNNNNFNDMLNLESFIKEKYINIDYNILYFNFKRHDVPTDSNIINIVLKTTNLYDESTDAPFKELRVYCGKILAEMFNLS